MSGWNFPEWFFLLLFVEFWFSIFTQGVIFLFSPPFIIIIIYWNVVIWPWLMAFLGNDFHSVEWVAIIQFIWLKYVSCSFCCCSRWAQRTTHVICWICFQYVRNMMRYLSFCHDASPRFFFFWIYFFNVCKHQFFVLIFFQCLYVIWKEEKTEWMCDFFYIVNSLHWLCLW